MWNQTLSGILILSAVMLALFHGVALGMQWHQSKPLVRTFHFWDMLTLIGLVVFVIAKWWC